MAKNRERQILIIPPTERAFASELMVGIGQYASGHGPWIFYTHESSDWQFPQIKNIADWHGDGIIVPVMKQQTLNDLTALGCPYVNTTAWPDIPTVTNDNAAIGRLGAEHLLEKGFHRFAFLGLPTGIYIRERQAAFAGRIAEAGFKCQTYSGDYRTHEDWSWQGVQRDLQKWLQSLEYPIAIMTYNDSRARQLLEAARTIGLKVPNQVAVLGVDNDPILGELSSPTLSSIELNGERAGFEAAALLDRLMSGESAPSSPIFIAPRGVVERRSTDALFFADQDVARAIQYIRARGNRQVLVDELVDVLQLSRATIERRFRKTLGHSPFFEIRKAQISHIQRLLRETDWPISRVAAASAFPDARRLSVVFREETGLTATEYRNQFRVG